MKKTVIVEYLFITRVVIDVDKENLEEVVRLSKDKIQAKIDNNELAEHISDLYDDEECPYTLQQKRTKKKDEIEEILIRLITSLHIDIPDNFEDIVQYVFEDVCETADTDNWHEGDVAIGFRRWIESK